MTREIKFRLYDTHKKTWEVPAYTSFLEDGFFGIAIETNQILMQYTGLKDRNGVEIYEGDIIAWNKMKTQKGEVYFEKGRFWVKDFYAPSQDEPSDAFGERFTLLDIIGNIHENPELITSNNE